MRTIPALVAALALPSVQPVLIAAGTSAVSVVVAQAPAQAQSANAVGRVAKAITVRIEGATQGSGVLVERVGNRYTVLTAWHVVAGHVEGEELDIYTPDGKRHQLNEGSIQRLGEVDLAVLTFLSSIPYELATVGDVKSVSMGGPIYVAGFPLPSGAVPMRLLRFLKGEVIANATVFIPNGYQLLYSNSTLPGMSGGAVLNAQGQLVGIHGQGETDVEMSEQQGVAVKTGTNQAVPIVYYKQHSSGAPVIAVSKQAATVDDYLAQAKALLGKRGSEQEVIRLVNRVLSTGENARAYMYRGWAKKDLKDSIGAIEDLDKSIKVNPRYAKAFYNRGVVKHDMGDSFGSMSDFSKAIAIDPKFSMAYYNRSILKYSFGDKIGSVEDLNKAIENSGKHVDAYYNRGIIKYELGNVESAISDFSQAVAIDPEYAAAWRSLGVAKYYKGDLVGGCNDTRMAASLGFEPARANLSKFTCQ